MHLIGTFCIVNSLTSMSNDVSLVNLIGTFCIVNYLLSYPMFQLDKFNRNILYCKFTNIMIFNILIIDLIGTFCIVNVNYFLLISFSISNLIGTFCIVN